MLIHLPTWDYVWASERHFGPWVLLWVVTQPEFSVLLRYGWVVQIGEGRSGKEKMFLELEVPLTVAKLDTKQKQRISFRARRAWIDDAGPSPFGTHWRS